MVYEDQEPTPMLTCPSCKCSSPVALWWRKNADVCDVCHWYAIRAQEKRVLDDLANVFADPRMDDTSPLH